MIRENNDWQREQTNASGADLKAAATELDAERQKTAKLAEEAEMNAIELATAEQSSGRLEKQKVKLEKQVVKMKEEKAELKKHVVSDGKIVVNEKVYTRLKAELARVRKTKNSNKVKEQNAEACKEHTEDLEQIRKMAAELCKCEVRFEDFGDDDAEDKTEVATDLEDNADADEGTAAKGVL